MSSWVIGVDPGEKHVGMALFSWDHEARCVDTVTLKPHPAMDRLASWLTDHRPVAKLVIEEFRLYDGTPLTWSDCPTIETVGVAKWIARGFGVPVHMQGAAIKKPAGGLMRHHGLRCVGLSGHARDAELHVWYWLMREAGYLTARQGVR